MGSLEHLDLENGDLLKKGTMGKEENLVVGRTAQNISASLVRKKSDPMLVSKVRFQMVRVFLANIQEVILGTKLCLLFPAIPLAILAECYEFGRPWVFALSLLGLTPLAERVSFLTEQIAYYTGPTVGGLLNATCGNATELIIALFALYQRKIHVKQSDVNMLLLLLGMLCLLLPLMFRYAVEPGSLAAGSILHLSRASSIMMLLAYFAYLFFQLKTHRQLFETNEAASDSWGISVSFISVILLPIVGNAAEHAGSIIFAFKNKLDITLGVALGSAAQISMFVVPLCVIVAWIMGVHMDLDFNLLETGSLGFSIILTAFTLQDGTSHYMKGIVLCLCYAIIGACFFVHRIVLDQNAASGALAA
ncbi:hypothetical protein RHMOL_Rhmol13G0084800 [Rhododendron molle]|uniref:Uncharacterized protein n=1 Tax=Rhododendron molle TaxID=49168 RepID=A0ACC0L4Y6_RHOML|nr:hypothetical protein RHMOL_Rhmol13G0084800 [Rhododendron molle]